MTWRIALLLSVLALLPFGRASELPVLLGALIGLADLWRQRATLRDDPIFRLILLCFLAYWVPELVSALDSVAPSKSWSEVALDLRYAPFFWFARESLRTPDAGKVALGIAATLTGVLLLDALVQAAFGHSLGGPLQADRLSGLFGENLKLGPVLAALAPLLILPVQTRFGRAAAAMVWLLLAVAILLAGARAGWISFALVSLLLLRHAVASRRAFLLSLLGLGLLGALSATTLYQVSGAFAERVNRTLSAFEGSESAIDHALAFRLPIWRAAWHMSLDHPVNGVGVRAFRYAYPPYAEADDRWMTDGDGIGAFHAHQLVLELSSETGLVGVLFWLFATVTLWRTYRRQQGEDRRAARPYVYALVSMLFPLNTHFAVYSSFWGTLMMLMLAMWLATLNRTPKA
ncbi:MAG: O-antigen ligase family protein [Ahniella sp.]|nr:O-antigen ligase family protein [Ahniella sp.]